MTEQKTTTTRDLLLALVAEIDQTSPEMLPPPNPRQKGEKVVAILADDYVKQVFSLANFYRREAQRHQVDLEAAGDDPKHDQRFNELKQKHETLQELFWYLLRAHTNIWAVSVGIRKGWEMVDRTKADDVDDQVQALLKKLFGE